MTVERLGGGGVQRRGLMPGGCLVGRRQDRRSGDALRRGTEDAVRSEAQVMRALVIRLTAGQPGVVVTVVMMIAPTPDVGMVALVAVQTDTYPLSLLYCFDLGTRWSARRGFLPGGPLPEVASRFPVDLSPLYALHDGLVHMSSGEAGPLPMEEWTAISDEQGGELMEVLSEGGRGLGFDLSVDPVRSYWLDADNEKNPVREVEDPWAFMDQFMVGWLERQE